MSVAGCTEGEFFFGFAESTCRNDASSAIGAGDKPRRRRDAEKQNGRKLTGMNANRIKEFSKYWRLFAAFLCHSSLRLRVSAVIFRTVQPLDRRRTAGAVEVADC